MRRSEAEMIFQSCLDLAASQTASEGHALEQGTLGHPSAGNTLSSWRIISEGRPEGCLTEWTIDGHLESMRKSPGVADGSHCLWICFNHGMAVVVRESFHFILNPKPLSQQVPNTCTHFDYEQEKENDPCMIWVELWWKVKVKSLSHSNSLGPHGL